MSSDIIKSFVKRVSCQIKDFQRDTYDNLKTWTELEETKDYYGIMAPIDSYMNLSPGIMEPHVWQCFDIGDVVIGRVVSKLERGLNVCLICFDGGKVQDIESLEIEARCPRSEIPTITNHEDPLSRYSIRDLVRGEIISIHRREQKLTMTLRANSSYDKKLTYGVIADENLPVSYKRMCTNNETYDKLLQLSTGFYNPNVIDFLKERLIPGRFSSFLKDLREFSCTPDELAPALRKRQSAKLAKKSVTKGINYYRKDMMYEALQELNHALEVDPVNVDAFVARGALYANKRTFAKAIGDFEKALSLDQHNKNARKYLLEVLIERAKSIEQDVQDLEQIKEASRLYERALTLDPDCSEAQIALGTLEKSEKEFRKRHRRSSSTDSASSSDNSTAQKSEKTATIVKVRQLLQHDVDARKKSKRTRKSESSSSSFQSDSSSSSSSESSASSPIRKRRKISSSQGKLGEPDKHQAQTRKASHSSKEESQTRRRDSCDDTRRSVHERPAERQRDLSRSERDTDSRKRRRSFDKSDNRYRDNRPTYTTNSDSRNSRNSQSYPPRRPSDDFGRNSTSNRERRSSQNSYDSNRYRRSSFAGNSARRDANSRDNYQKRPSTTAPNKDSDKPVVSKPITKVTKDNFSNILDQISKFERQKSSK